MADQRRPEMGLDYPELGLELRLDDEWRTVVAVRDILNIGHRGTTYITYSQAIFAAARLAPEIFDQQSSLLMRERLSSEARAFAQKADIIRATDSTVTALKLVRQEAEEIEFLLLTGRDRETSDLRKRLRVLRRIESELTAESYTENEVIVRDAVRANRSLPVSNSGRDYKEFRLSGDRVLRVRMLHPGRPEATTGTDVMYELFSDDLERVRLVFLQYKIWTRQKRRERWRLNISPNKERERFERQIGRLQDVCCASNLCSTPACLDEYSTYRLPFCCAFLRPTDKLQSADVKMVSTGYHVPICRLATLWDETERGGLKLAEERIEGCSLSTSAFEELFVANMVGSKWIPRLELEALHERHGITTAFNGHSVIHAQEYPGWLS